MLTETKSSHWVSVVAQSYSSPFHEESEDLHCACAMPATRRESSRAWQQHTCLLHCGTKGERWCHFGCRRSDCVSGAQLSPLPRSLRYFHEVAARYLLLPTLSETMKLINSQLTVKLLLCLKMALDGLKLVAAN